MNQFYSDVVKGLSSNPKYLLSKYFYDDAGDVIFEKIMRSPDYYLTRCELSIFKDQTQQLIEAFDAGSAQYDIVELGAGDALKTSHLLRYLVQNGKEFTYYPIDISKQVIQKLEMHLPRQIPWLQVTGLNGEYFPMLEEAGRLSGRKKVVLFLGSNIGNMYPREAQEFCRQLNGMLMPGDILLMGADLKKHPETILKAYNDEEGLTREFNLNLLRRMNSELDADFDVSAFQHFQTYDPGTGSCKSYLISLADQEVTIGSEKKVFYFSENESIFTEVSQKYSPGELGALAESAGFTSLAQFFDSRSWFTDVIWGKV
ncbi:L-histidine N(alpha)-methyltransferase [Pararcticibacter amylolyticus]|uniref:L-histidine N(Alpha)-methyltransferase n=1 Tax=Pararcticibacter amylolyticus TaxID=2173175 RepID=A0A2U2PMB1_9SPHI|nr:L-histidine N(alpha)-methyltransferase [Pararcticibacter amylolyticus]PWG82458.1 L-histidine N(alpha)-methyltransferase [Pararcticibacter amylolyticus]